MNGLEIFLIILLILFLLGGIALTIYLVVKDRKTSPSNPPPNPPPNPPNGCTGGTTGCTGNTGGGFTGLIPVNFFTYSGKMDTDANFATQINGIDNIEDCKIECLQDPDCYLLSYDISNKICYLMQPNVNNTNNSENPLTALNVYDNNNRANFVVWKSSIIYGNDVVNGRTFNDPNSCIAYCNNSIPTSNFNRSFITQIRNNENGIWDCFCKGTIKSNPETWQTLALGENK